MTTLEQFNVMTRQRCDFCDELSGGSNNAFVSTYSHCLPDRIIWESERLVVLPSMGQIVPGHLLIIPKAHITAFADARPAVLDELMLAKARIRKIFFNDMTSCVFFEHGTRTAESGGCGVYHAHMHAVPIKFTCDPVQLLKGVSFTQVADCYAAFFRMNSSSSYVFFENALSQCFVAEVSTLPSQALRKALSEITNNPVWDWRAYGFEPSLLETLDTLRSEFATVV